MTIRKALFTLSLALPLALAGCPSTEEGGSTVFPCSTNADCAADAEICHPVGKICVPTCEEASDCPDNQNECAAITVNGTALTTELVCQCKTGDAAFCTSEDTTVELVCSPVDNVCETKCATNDDCAAFTTFPRECVDGICQAPALCTAASCTDPAASKCGADGACAACTEDKDCAHIADGKTHCAAGVCVVPTCNQSNDVPGTNGGPDICAYGQDCTAAGCADIPAATCAGASHVTWNKANQGPVITSISPAILTEGTSTDICSGGGRSFKVTISFYAPKGLTYTASATSNTLLTGQIVIVKPDGTSSNAANVRDVPASGATNGTFSIYSCGVSSASVTEGRAIYLKDLAGNAGNAVCVAQ